jgi:hypothetical protein
MFSEIFANYSWNNIVVTYSTLVVYCLLTLFCVPNDTSYSLFATVGVGSVFSINVWAGIVGDCFSRTPCFAKSACRQKQPRFPLTRSAKATGRRTTGSKSTNVEHAKWHSGTF